MRLAPGIDFSSGSLGHNLSVGAGMAMAGRLARRDYRVFVLTGDGELQEGSNWEAIMAAAHFGLDNLCVIVDRNGIQQGAPTESTIRMEPLADRFRAFGWAVCEVAGHDHAALLAAFAALPADPGKPTCLIARTVKGRGVSFIENRPEWHHHVPTDAELAAALAELEGGAHG